MKLKQRWLIMKGAVLHKGPKAVQEEGEKKEGNDGVVGKDVAQEIQGNVEEQWKRAFI